MSSSLEATKAEFDELLEKFERCLAKGNKLNQELTLARLQGEKLARELMAAMKKAGEHSGEPGAMGVFSEMCARLQAVQDRNPTLPIQ